MAENTSGATYEPGIYVKGDEKRVARTRSVAVALVFDGYRLESAEVAPQPEAPTAPTATSNESEPAPTPKPSEPKSRKAEKSTEDSNQ